MPFIASMSGGVVVIARLWRFLRIAETTWKGQEILVEFESQITEAEANSPE